MLGDGLKLMVLGVGYVFFFLSLMVVFMKISSRLLAPWAHLLAEKVAVPRASSSSNKPKGQQLIAAAIAAVHLHRRKRK